MGLRPVSFPLAGGRDSASGGGWGNAPTVPRPTSMGEVFLSVLVFFIAEGFVSIPPLFREKSFRSVHSLLARRGKVCYNTHG